MNEQLKQLIEQAGFEENDGRISIQGVYMFNTYRMKKLAELIVQECAKQCDPEPGIKYSPNAASSRQDCKEKILQLLN